ncbi:MAG TPA: tetratricopeptide repeat protein [Sandaracinaceae bacterium LLY-WYZ-13_1]|nr:tetratricopeptide repeat protein [Sandaracinaceae bacterium LLY-WYZ-13_1]
MAEETPRESGAADAEAEERFASALAAAETEPDHEEHWDLLEEMAEQLQRPDEVGELYRKVLGGDASPDLAATLGQRAAQFHEEWFSEDSPHLVGVLTRVLELDPEADWALQRLTVVMTVGERWNELLALYDRSLAAAADDARREQLLDEAAQLAKDFAGAPDRAIDYLKQLLELRPKDGQLVSSLERLLERQGRWEELIALWRRRIEGASAKDAMKLRGRIAACYLDNLEDAGSTLEEVRGLLEDGADEEPNLALLERVVALEGASPEVRRGALDVLRERYEASDRADDVIRVVGVALGFAEGAERIALHRELGTRLAAAGDAAQAMEHWASVLQLDPAAEDAQEELAHLARSADAHDRYASALVAAADAAEPGPRQYALLVEAGDVRANDLGEREAAIELYQRVLSADARGSTKLTVARRLEKLLDDTERHAERLQVLEGLAGLETDPVETRRVLGQCARLAERLEDHERALGFWQRRLEAEPSDLEALDAMIELSERIERWDLHVDALRRRVAADVPSVQRRLDLARIASTQAGQLGQIAEAIETWNQIQQDFGEDAETVDALFELLIRAERFEEVYELLERAVERDAARAAEVLSRVADVARGHLGRLDQAAKAYHRAILMEPSLERAREGLQQLLSDDAARAPAVRGLAKAYELTDDWQALLDLLEHRVELALDDMERVAVLREASELYEERAEQPAAAFDSVRRALRHAPANPELEAELTRLAEATDRWADAAETLGDAAGALAETRKGRAAELYRRQATIREQRLEDAAGALEAWLTAQDLVPHDEATAAEAVRVGASAGRWDGAARAVVTVSKARDALQEERLADLEARAREAGAMAELAAGTTQAIPAPGEVDAELGRALEAKVASWLSGDVEDLEGAEAALHRALGHEPAHTETLRELARLQWRTPGRPLVDTLLKLADNFPDDLDPLYDAARIAIDPVGDDALATSILDRLLRNARRLWESAGEASGERPAGATAVWALEELVRIALEGDDAQKAVDLLVSGARMPVEADKSREMRRRAGELCREKLGDQDRALSLLQSVVDESVEDAEAVDQLGKLLEERARLPELLALRQRQLGIELDPDTRFGVRLEVARVLGLIEERGGRIGVLRENLEEHPGHLESVEGLAEILSSRGRHEELAELYTTQAGEVEQQGDVNRAANLWARAAELLEERLNDVKRALEAHRRVVTLEPSPTSLDALARLHVDRDEPAVAAEWLERRLEAAHDEERGAVGLRLADAHLAAGQAQKATKVLEQMVQADPTASEARERLASLYREADAHEPLAKLLADGAPHEPDEQTRLAYVREAAHLYEHELESPDEAIPVLQMGVELAPDDQELKSKLALGLRVAGRHDEAREILEALVQQFGRRRSPERAAVHYQLAQVAHAAGDLEEAMKQLEQARKMDMSHPGILRMAGQMAREAGQLERAEKAYRALLLVVRRQDASDEDLQVGPSEVLYELSLLATAQEDEDQAKELLETALSTASGHDAESERLMRDLLARGEVELALSVVERRLESVEEPASKARMLAHRARVLADHLDRKDEALEALLEAVELAPEEAELQERCRALAREMGATERYAATLRELADQSRRKEEQPFVAGLLLRLGEVTEHDLGDLDAAAELYQRVEKLGARVVDAWQALARVADARGDGAEEVRVLRKLVEAEGEAVPNDARTQALYRIAEVELGAGEVEPGLETLRSALDREPRYARAGTILQAAAQEVPDDDDLLAVYEEVARASGDPPMVLDFLERRAARPDGTLDHVREGVERADAVEAPERAEALLRRGMELARDSELGLRDALWVPIGLAERRQAAGDVPGAIEHMRAAAEVADGEEGFQLWMRVADLASQEGGDLGLAAETYRSLLNNDPSNRELWEPLAGVYAKLGDRAGLEEVVQTTLDALLDPADRNELRMFHASFLLDVAEARDEAVTVLKNVLDEDPDHVDAAQRLADIFEATGDRAELVELLQRQLDRARDRQDVEAIVALSLRMGKLIEPEDADAAIDFYRAGLDWAPESPELLAALLAHYGEDSDPRERAELMERLLAVSSGPDAAALANRLIALYQSLDDEYAAARALDLGFKAHPADASLRDRLEQYYREREETAELAAMIAYDAEHREDDDEAIARAQQAMQLFRNDLDSPGQAAEVARVAWQRRPQDLGLLEALVGDLSAAGLHSAASADVAAALEQYEEPGPERASLLRMRARLELALGNPMPAVEDLEAAYEVAPEQSAQDLVAGLDALRKDAPDLDAEREATHRLAEVLKANGNPEDSRDVLAEWVEKDPTDREALRTLREVDGAAERWADVARHEARRVDVEEGEAQVEAALGLLDACRRVEQPAEARAGLERVREAQPDDARVFEALKSLYEEIGANRELSAILLAEAQQSEDPEVRFDCFRRAGDLMIAEGDAEGALEPLAQAATIKPDDHDLTISLADAYMGSGRLQEAVELLQEAINGFKRRRSPHLAAMQLRMARIAGISGDAETQKEWLSVALDADKNNGEVAAELAELSMELGDDDTALKALRVVTLQKTPGPMSKAVAFLRQAQIAHRQGDQQKAVLWARRARLEDEELDEAQQFLEQIGEA